MVGVPRARTAANHAGRTAAASAAIEAAAIRQGLQVRRLTDEIVVCVREDMSVAFRGFAGRLVGLAARALCRNRGALMAHLSARGLPVATEDPGADSVDGLVELAVVGDAVVDHHPPVPGIDQATMADVARDAVRALPGARYGSVSVTMASTANGPEAPVSVVAIDPLLTAWALRREGSDSLALATAILDLECSSPC